jgi:hypothetical protein
MSKLLNSLIFVLCGILAPILGVAGELLVRVEKPDWFKRTREDTSWTIFLEGEIEPGSAKKVAAALRKTAKEGADVYLNSPGGDLFEGMEIGRLIRKARANTYLGSIASGRMKRDPFGGPELVVETGQCYSSCVLAFLGGFYRFSGETGIIGVHRFRHANPKSSSPRDLELAQITSAAIGSYIREMDVDPGLFDLMVERGPNEIRILSKTELGALNVSNNGRLRPEWSIEAVSGG